MSSSVITREVAGAILPAQPLLTPFSLGDLSLRNRVVMAPLTRMRAHPHDHVPTPLQAKYYAQRASAGLIVAEATAISPDGFGWADTPGLWSKEQVRGWRLITDAVHNAGGRIVAQLWHTGALSHPELRDGLLPVSASDVNPGQLSFTRDGRKPTVAPRPLTGEEIKTTIRDYSRAARNATDAGFDGVQILANYLYLIAQFLNATTNRRTDDYGGSIENRARFLFEVLESVLAEVPAERVGVKISPMHESDAFAANEENWTTISYPDPNHINVARDKDSKGDGLLTSSRMFDGVGRPTLDVAPGGVTVQTGYDGLGRVQSVSISNARLPSLLPIVSPRILQPLKVRLRYPRTKNLSLPALAAWKRSATEPSQSSSPCSSSRFTALASHRGDWQESC